MSRYGRRPAFWPVHREVRDQVRLFRTEVRPHLAP
jgi:hypothetical protein